MRSLHICLYLFFLCLFCRCNLFRHEIKYIEKRSLKHPWANRFIAKNKIYSIRRPTSTHNRAFFAPEMLTPPTLPVPRITAI